MKTHVLTVALLLFSISAAFAQNTGTLKVFSEDPVVVYVDETQYPSYNSITLTAGTHYVKALNKDGEKVYSNIVTITSGQVTTVLVEASGTVARPATATGAQPVTQGAPASAGGTGTLNIFSEFTGTTVYLDDIKQGEDVKTVNGIPAGNHYLKIMKDGIGIFGELVVINPGQTSTVLVKNDGQVAEKILEGKTKEREEFNSKKLDVIYSTNSVSTTSGTSTLFPGYYGYYGFSNSTTNTEQISDFKIIKGGVQEITDVSLAKLVGNQSIVNSFDADYRSWQKAQNTGAIIGLGALVPYFVVLVDMGLKKPFLHENPTGESINFSAVPAWEWTTLIVSGLVAWAGVKMMDTPQHKYVKRHYYRVDAAAKDAAAYNKKLKEELGLPENYGVK